jgi:glycosyltransferase involved in cell wall biosynthesis
MMNDNFYRSSGAGIAIRRIAQALTDVDYFVAAGEIDDRSQDLGWVPEGRFARFNLKSSHPLVAFRELRRFKRWFRANHCDLVHCHHRRLAVLMQLIGVPVLYTGQLAFPYQTWFRWLHPRKMTAITNSVAENIFEGTGQKVLACISNPVEFPEASPVIDIDKVNGRAICIARLEPVKGHVHLLAAWKLLLDRGHRYTLDLVGEGTLYEALKAQIERDGLNELIRFVGFTSDVSSVISNALFAVLASEMEGQGIVTLEAAAMGRASLLTAIPGSIDLLPPDRHLPNGVPFGDVKALADAVEAWFANPVEVVGEGQRFFKFLKSSSDPNTIAVEYTKVYRQIVVGKA